MENLTVSTALVAQPAGAITVDLIKEGFKGKEAQIRQTFIKAYPSQKTENEFKDSLFSHEELGIETTDYKEERVTWIPVHEDHTEKDVIKALKAVPEARIYKVLSKNPIVSSDQQSVLDNGLTDAAFKSFVKDNGLKGKKEWDEECSAILYAKIEQAQLIRNEDDEEVLFNGAKQYRQVFFSKTYRPDMDLRSVGTKQEMPELILATQEVNEKVEA